MNNLDKGIYTVDVDRKVDDLNTSINIRTENDKQQEQITIISNVLNLSVFQLIIYQVILRNLLIIELIKKIIE